MKEKNEYAPSNFDKAVEVIFLYEGGYINHPNDPGGETKYGISKRAYPNEDIKNLTKERAKEIYKENYWDKIKGDEIRPYLIALQTFDIAVNSGVYRASKLLQLSLNKIGAHLVVDGIIGKNTLKVINALSFDEIIELNNTMVEMRIAFYDGLIKENPKLAVFRKGWIRRAEHFKV
jgi:lysozyme family protein